MKHLLLATIATAALASAAAAPVRATVITYDLNTVISGTLTPSASYGTVTYADDAATPNAIDVTITLNGSGQKIQEFNFNYNDTKFSNTTPFVLTGDVTSYSISENATQADGYSAGKFDVQTPDHGNIGTQPISFQISLAGVKLDPTDFDFLDTSGKLYNAIHVGNCGTGSDGCLPGGGNGSDSIWIGSGAHVTPPPSPVPEPASLALIASGLLVAGLLRQRAHRG